MAPEWSKIGWRSPFFWQPNLMNARQKARTQTCMSICTLICLCSRGSSFMRTSLCAISPRCSQMRLPQDLSRPEHVLNLRCPPFNMSMLRLHSKTVRGHIDGPQLSKKYQGELNQVGQSGLEIKGSWAFTSPSAISIGFTSTGVSDCSLEHTGSRLSSAWTNVGPQTSPTGFRHLRRH